MGAMLRYLFQVLGVVLILSGGQWTLQGLGIIMWPAESFMLAERQWALYGAITAIIGVILFWRARWRR